LQYASQKEETTNDFNKLHWSGVFGCIFFNKITNEAKNNFQETKKVICY
jgi:hypothetical protein